MVLLISNLPEYHDDCYKEKDVADLLCPFGFDYSNEHIYVIPQARKAFVLMPNLYQAAQFVRLSKNMGIFLKGSALDVKMITCFRSKTPFEFYKSLMKLGKYPIADDDRLSTIYIQGIPPDTTKNLREALKRIGCVRNILPLMNKMFVQFESMYDADRLGVWHSLRKCCGYSVRRLKIPRSEEISKPPRLAAKALPNSKDVVPGVTIPTTSSGVPVGSSPPFWVAMTTCPFVFPTASPWFLIPDNSLITSLKTIKRVSFLRQPIIMLTGLPEGNYQHRDVAKLVWPHFPKQTLHFLTHNILVLSLQRRAFVFFINWKACIDFVQDHLKNPCSVKGQKIHIHIVLQTMNLGHTMEFIYKNLMSWSNTHVPKLESLEERLLCVEISETSIELIMMVTDVVASSAPFQQYLPLANRIYFEMADANAVTQVVKKISSIGPISYQKLWSKVQRVESLKSLKKRLGDLWDMTVNADGTVSQSEQRRSQSEAKPTSQGSTPPSAMPSASAGATTSNSIKGKESASAKGLLTNSGILTDGNAIPAASSTCLDKSEKNTEKLPDYEQSSQTKVPEKSRIKSENEQASVKDTKDQLHREDAKPDHKASADGAVSPYRHLQPIHSPRPNQSQVLDSVLVDSSKMEICSSLQEIDSSTKGQGVIKEEGHLVEVSVANSASEKDMTGKAGSSDKNAIEDTADKNGILDLDRSGNEMIKEINEEIILSEKSCKQCKDAGLIKTEKDHIVGDEENKESSANGTKKEYYKTLDSLLVVGKQNNKDTSTGQEAFETLTSSDKTTDYHSIPLSKETARPSEIPASSGEKPQSSKTKSPAKTSQNSSFGSNIPSKETNPSTGASVKFDNEVSAEGVATVTSESPGVEQDHHNKSVHIKVEDESRACLQKFTSVQVQESLEATFQEPSHPQQDVVEDSGKFAVKDTIDEIETPMSREEKIENQQEESIKASMDASQIQNDQDQPFENGDNKDASGTEGERQILETSSDPLSRDTVRFKEEETQKDVSSDQPRITETDSKIATPERANTPTRRSGRLTRACKSEAKEKSPVRMVQRYETRLKRRIPGNGTEDTVDSSDKESNQGTMEASGRRRSARVNKEERTVLTVDKPSPTTTTRSTRGRGEVSADKEPSSERTKQNKMPTRRQSIKMTEEKTISKECTPTKKSETDENKEVAAHAVLDSVEEIGDQSATVGKAKRGKPRKGNKSTKIQTESKDGASSKVANEEEATESSSLLDSVENKTVENQLPAEKQDILTCTAAVEVSNHMGSEEASQHHIDDGVGADKTKGGGWLKIPEMNIQITEENKVQTDTVETHLLHQESHSSNSKILDKEVKEEAEETQSVCKRKSGDKEESANSQVGEMEEEEKETLTSPSKGQPRKRTRLTPVRKSPRGKQQDETEKANKDPPPPLSCGSSSSINKDSLAQSGDDQPEIQKTEMEAVSQSDVPSDGQQKEPECSDNQKENVMGENEERRGQNRADIKVASKERRDEDRSEPKRWCSKDKVELPPFNPNNPIGQEHVVYKRAFLCKVCSIVYINEIKAREDHCRSQMHYDNLKKYIQKKKNLRTNKMT
ncbi:uncharacterized protein KZ484_023077 [Pholidichthys leucotaenia]